MLVFCHLFIGAVLGLLLYRRWHLRWMVPVAALGAILPDLIDKPLGHLLLQNTLDFGRIYAHSLLFLAGLTLLAVALWRVRGSLLLAVLAVGVASHLVLDSMWDLPVSLLWPALGPFQAHHFPDYFASSFVTEITSPLEWLFGLAVVMIIVPLYQDRLGRWGPGLMRFLYPLRPAVLAFLLVGGAITTVLGLAALSNDWLSGEAQVIEGLCAVFGSAVLIRLASPADLGPGMR